MSSSDPAPGLPFDLTEKWLSDAAGWKVLKEARSLHQGGGVAEVRVEGRRLKGVVVAQGKPQVAGFEIESRTDLRNLCPCHLSRRYGQVCAHSTAVALAHILGAGSPVAPAGIVPGKIAPVPSVSAREQVRPETRGGVCVRFDARFAELWEKGRIPVRVEPAAQGGEVVWKWLDRAKIGKLPAVCVVNPEQAIDLLEVLQDTGAGRRGEDLLVVAGTSAARVRVRLETGADGDFRLTPLVREGNQQQWLRAGNRRWVYFAQRALLEPVRPAPAGAGSAYDDLLDGKAVTLPPGLLLAGLGAWHDSIEFLSEPGQGIILRPGVPTFSARFEGSFHALSGVVTVGYGEAVTFRLGAEPPGGSFPYRADDGSFVTRNQRAERLGAARLEEFGFTGPDAAGQFHLRGEKEVGRFYARGYPELVRHWKVELGERFQHVSRQVEIIRPRLEQRGSDANWFGFALRYSGEGGVEISRQEIQKLLAKGQSKVQLANGRSAFVDLEACAEADEVIFDAQPVQEDGLFRVRAAQAGFLRTAFQGELEDGEPVDLEPLGELEVTLRDYQRDGVRWLAGIWRGPAGAGLLADEMGLGKTLQALAGAEWLWQTQGKGQILVVAPTSLLHNWRKEAERFLPGRRCHVWHGSRRWEEEREIETADLLVTSYALLVRDVEALAGREFLAVILDEAGAIKNPDTQSARAARKLRARARLALSGTPVENSVRELWSIFEFLIPGYLGRREEFRERYELPLSGGAAPRPVLERLRQRIQPVMLRRLKESVAKELPPKIEQVRTCELTPGQAKLYESILRESRKQIDDALAKKSEGQARMTMLTALLRLRQVCCDPRLLGVEDAAKAGSAKLELFDELLEECESGGHKALVFSQFTGMLGLLRQVLDARGTPYCYLDGSSTDRAEQVERFQGGHGPGLFLISLKAGGYGLTLTAADTVIHYDPWWNPAVEAQATDRAHRIGQSRPVSSYKLIAAGTVEEKIVALQRKKRDVIEAALDDAAPLMQGLSLDDLREVMA
ncbi:MAG: Superfamily II DNA or RNA helicase, SNF2 family [Verrucomicrobia bacterium]|nr:MAG: Superfamily II DNA or RNA helicase, SNF2 family [Verrucomicrobiota bacterium]